MLLSISKQDLQPITIRRYLFELYPLKKKFIINFCYYFHEKKSLKKINSLATEITVL